jgi:hypothetical protein
MVTSVMEYGIIFWRNSSESRKGFQLQKKTIRIMAGSMPRTSYKSLFKTLEILTIPSQYILLLMTFLISNLEHITLQFII